jgi:hypothetical protein
MPNGLLLALLVFATAESLVGCARGPRVVSTSQPAPPDDPNDVYTPGGSCCRVDTLSLALDDLTPWGVRIGDELAKLRDLTCPVRYHDGAEGKVRIQLGEPHALVFRAAHPDGDRCPLCFSEVTLEATLVIALRDGQHHVSTATLRELDPDSGFSFEAAGPSFRAGGLLQVREPALRLWRDPAATDLSPPYAEASAPCAPTPTAEP